MLQNCIKDKTRMVNYIRTKKEINGKELKN